MTIVKQLGILIIVSLMASTFLKAAISDDIISKADIIVVGTIASGTETDQNVSFDLSVIRVIKGSDIPQLLHVSHDWIRRGVMVPAGPILIDFHAPGIWLLKKATGGSLDVLPGSEPDGILTNLCFPAVEQLPSAYQYPSSVSVAEKVVLEAGAGMQNSKIAPMQFLDSLGGINSPAVDRILTGFMQSPDLSFQVVGLSGLLGRNAPGSISKLAKMWPAIRDNHYTPLVISAVRNSFRDTSPESVQQLIAMANDPSSASDLRAAIVWALKAMHTKESISFLASLLSSKDASERMNAVIGISSFANGCPAQTPANVASMEYMHFRNPSPYRTPETIAAFAFGPVTSEREAELVDFWTGWWNQNKAGF